MLFILNYVAAGTARNFYNLDNDNDSKKKDEKQCVNPNPAKINALIKSLINRITPELTEHQRYREFKRLILDYPLSNHEYELAIKFFCRRYDY